MEAIMRVTVRGWGRDHGETEIVNVALGDAADSGPDPYYLIQGYCQIENAWASNLAKAKLSAGTEPLRLGGSRAQSGERPDNDPDGDGG
jgi:hypothetical protein